MLIPNYSDLWEFRERWKTIENVKDIQSVPGSPSCQEMVLGQTHGPVVVEEVFDH